MFSVDDYGNIRIDSKYARKNLENKGFNVKKNRFDYFDALEDKNDLTQLFDTLSKFKDVNNNNPLFTAFVNVKNIDFVKTRENNYSKLYTKKLDRTFDTKKGYEGVFELWQEGIKEKFIFPQYHGREHFNFKMIENLMLNKDKELLTCFDNLSLISFPRLIQKNISFARAYSFINQEELETLVCIAKDGVDVFNSVFGFSPCHFTSPGALAHHQIEESLYTKGIQIVDSINIKKEHNGGNKFNYTLKYNGMKNSRDQRYIIRNCVFEPLLNPSAVEDCLYEMDVAFENGKAANISSHRVNFGGHIEDSNRNVGLKSLNLLLKKMLKKWPDIEFMNTVEYEKLFRD